MGKYFFVILLFVMGLIFVVGISSLEDKVTRCFITLLGVLMIGMSVAKMGYYYTIDQNNRKIEATIADTIKKEESEKEEIIDFLNESRNDPEHRYIIDGIELQDIDENTIKNCDRYHIVIDEETKTIIITTRDFGR